MLKRLMQILIVTGLVIALGALFVSPALAASASCNAINGVSSGVVFGGVQTVNQTGFLDSELITVTTTLPFGSTGPNTAQIETGGGTVVAGPATMGGVLVYTTTAAGAYTIRFNGTDPYTFSLRCIEAARAGEILPLPPNLLDGRINNDPLRDIAAPIAIYIEPLSIYAIDPAAGRGQLALRVTTAQIETLGVPQGRNRLLAQGVNPFTDWPIMVYRLTTGEFQVDTYYADGKFYSVAWDMADWEDLYHLTQ